MEIALCTRRVTQKKQLGQGDQKYDKKRNSIVLKVEFAHVDASLLQKTSLGCDRTCYRN